MKILMVHNYYQQRGGEDAVFDREVAMLESHGHTVKQLTFHNHQIRGPFASWWAGLSSLFSIPAFFQTWKAIRQFHPDLLHAHNLFPLASPSILLAAKIRKVPVIVTLHNYRLICANAVLFRDGAGCQQCVKQRWPLAGILQGCYRNSRLQSAALVWMTSLHRQLGTWTHAVDRYITLSPAQREIILQSALGVPSEKLAIKPNFTNSPPPPSTQTTPAYFLFIGRLSVEKGVEPLLAAFKQSTLPLKIMGTGPMESTVQEAVSKSPNIEYLGFQDKATVSEMLHQAIALIFPSVCPETFGLSIIEAFAAQVPVIASNLGGPSNLVIHQENGLLVEPGLASALRAAAETLHSDTALRQQLAESAYRSFQAHYTDRRNYETLMDIYHDVLAAR